MPTPRFTPEELRQLHDLAARSAQIVSNRAFGDDGPGLDVGFRTFEQIATAAARRYHPRCSEPCGSEKSSASS